MISKLPNHQILLVDDDHTNARLISMLLEMDGFAVTACHTLAEARDTIHDNIEAMVFDYHLGNDERGIDLLIDVRNGETGAKQETPIIITTGDHRQARAAMDAGANKFMLKPFPPSELSQELKNILEKEKNE